jgi:hypothetical protein
MKIFLLSLTVFFFLIVVYFIGLDALFKSREMDFFLHQIDVRIKADIFKKNRQEITKFEIQNRNKLYSDKHKTVLIFEAESNTPYYRISYFLQDDKSHGFEFENGLVTTLYRIIFKNKIYSYLKKMIGNRILKNNLFIGEKLIVYLGDPQFKDAFLKYYFLIQVYLRHSAFGEALQKNW